MKSKYTLPKTIELIKSANISVIFGGNSKICDIHSANIVSYYFQNYECFNAENPSETINKVKKLLAQYALEHNSKLELLQIDLSKISQNYNSENLYKLLLELNELSKLNNFKIIVNFTTENDTLISNVYSNFTPEQQQQILFLRLSNTKPIKLVVETGKHKGKSINYKVRTELNFMEEID